MRGPVASVAFGRNRLVKPLALLHMTLTGAPVAESRDTGAVRAAAGAITVTTVSVLPVFLTGALAVQLGGELRFNPAGLGLWSPSTSG
jgi:hypothetical protein